MKQNDAGANLKRIMLTEWERRRAAKLHRNPLSPDRLYRMANVSRTAEFLGKKGPLIPAPMKEVVEGRLIWTCLPTMRRNKMGRGVDPK